MTAATSTSADPGPTIFVLYGATGDLAKRMVIPAFYSLAQAGLLPREWRLVGNGRGDVAHEDFQQHVHDVLSTFATTPEPAAWEDFRAHLCFAGGGFETSDPGTLLAALADARTALGEDAQLIHYLAVPPSAFEELTKALGEHGLAAGSRVVYEKPFGTSQANFEELDDIVHSVLDEDQVYRIDHFLGKEATQDLHVLRFGNRMFSAIWDREHVRSVQIDVPETLDIDDRAEFYDHTGAFLDMIVTHLFQLAAEVAMEPPVSMAAEDLQAARGGVIAAFRPLDRADVVLGQYDGYRDVPGIDPTSEMDTFVAARLWVDTDRWRDVPFLLRTGKMLAKSGQQVSLVLRQPEGPLTHVPVQGNVITFSLSGDGEVDITLVAKEPGPELSLVVTTSKITLDLIQGAEALAPYARLIHDVVIGDRALFTRPDGLAHVWDVAAPILNDRPAVQPYAPGSWGPAAAAELAAPDSWLLGQ